MDHHAEQIQESLRSQEESTLPSLGNVLITWLSAKNCFLAPRTLQCLLPVGMARVGGKRVLGKKGNQHILRERFWDHDTCLHSSETSLLDVRDAKCKMFCFLLC